jgi:hypothetical protein
MACASAPVSHAAARATGNTSAAHRGRGAGVGIGAEDPVNGAGYPRAKTAWEEPG